MRVVEPQLFINLPANINEIIRKATRYAHPNNKRKNYKNQKIE